MPVPAIVPFLPMIGQAIGSGIKAIGDSRAAKRQGQFYENLQRSGEQQAQELSKQREGLYELGPTMRKYMQYAMADPTADMQRQEAMRSSGTAVGALKAGGARAILGGLGRQQQMDASNMAQIAADEYRRKTGAMLNVGQQEQSLQSARRADITNDLNTARKQAASGLQGVFEANQMRRQVGTNLASGLAELGGQAAGIAYQNSYDNFLEGMTPGQRSMYENLENQGLSYSEIKDRLGFNNENGGKVKKTPGEFSHATNPINVMQDGAKIGELTGGEYVLNPQQAAAIARQSDIARKLFKKFDREA